MSGRCHRCAAGGAPAGVASGFTKSYYIDMLADRGVIYELKAAETLNRLHQQQVINYLLLANLSHGKLVNTPPRFGGVPVCIDPPQRPEWMTFRLADDRWRGDDQTGLRLREVLCGLLAEWSVFLDVNLYREALLHFLNGPDVGIQPVEIEVAGRIVGSQKMCLLDARTAWLLSAVRELHARSYETHVARLLCHARLDRIQWINLDQRIMTFTTLGK